MEKKPVSEVCNEAEIQPSLFYTWQRELLAGAHTVFSTRRAPSRENELEAKVSRLEARVARKNQIIAEVTEEYVTLKKKTWGSLNGAWIPHDRRDEVVDFVNTIATKTRLPVQQVVEWCGLARGKFYDWRKRYGKVNEHNGLVPRDHWIEDWERQRVIDYFDCHPLDGYRRLTFMMLDEDVVALSPSTTYRVLSKAGRLDRWNGKPSKKGTGFVQPVRAHQHWHTDISYLNLGGTFYYLCSFLDGASRAVVHWEIRESMTEADVECILERAKELYPDARPRIISDNGPQYIAKDFKTFIRISGMTHVRTAPYYPQSNGKIERWHKTIKSDALRPANPSSLEEARRLMERFVAYYNGVRLHSAIGYIAPLDGQVLIFLSNLRMVPRARLSCWFLRRAFGEELVSKFLDSPDCENIHPYAAPFTRCGQQDCEREFYRGLLGKEVRNDFRPTFEFSEGALEYIRGAKPLVMRLRKS